jgi:hypothetical protein
MSDFPIIASLEEFFNQHDYGLTEDQQLLIKKRLEDPSKPSLVQIAIEVFDDPNIVARDEKYNTIRKFCDKIKRDSPTVNLDEDAQKYIRKNASLMRPIDMARAIFNDPSLAPLSREVKTVEKFVRILGLGSFSMSGDSGLKDYVPPKKDSLIIAKINASDPSADFREDNLSSSQIRKVANLKSFLGNSRFLSLMNSITFEDERALFENEFVASAYNKMDMNAEDLQSCISLAYHYVLEKRIQKHLVILDEEIMKNVQDEDANLKMTLTEAYGKKSTELDQCVKRIQSLQKALSTNRSDRLKAQTEANKSILSLVDVWKEEETRRKAILVAKVTENVVKGEMSRLEDEESVIVSIYGISQDEITDGM